MRLKRTLQVLGILVAVFAVGYLAFLLRYFA